MLVGNEKRCLKPGDGFKDCPDCPDRQDLTGCSPRPARVRGAGGHNHAVLVGLVHCTQAGQLRPQCLPQSKRDGSTVAVDSFEPKPWGLYNVHGNVWEWTEDCWNRSNSGNPGDGRARR
jgi:Sulfatase-modifying factor enzyme 1